MLYFKNYILHYSSVVRGNECETVQESVKVFGGFAQLIVICPRNALPPFSGQDAPRPSLKRALSCARKRLAVSHEQNNFPRHEELAVFCDRRRYRSLESMTRRRSCGSCSLALIAAALSPGERGCSTLPRSRLLAPNRFPSAAV